MFRTAFRSKICIIFERVLKKSVFLLTSVIDSPFYYYIIFLTVAKHFFCTARRTIWQSKPGPVFFGAHTKNFSGFRVFLRAIGFVLVSNMIGLATFPAPQQTLKSNYPALVSSCVVYCLCIGCVIPQ